MTNIRYYFPILLLVGLCFTEMGIAFQEDSVIGGNLYTGPLTDLEKPRGYREQPPNHSLEPRNFKDTPPNFALSEEVRNYRANPNNNQVLDTLRNFEPNPSNFVEKDSTTFANTDPALKLDRDSHPKYNGQKSFRIEPEGSQGTSISKLFETKNTGYGSPNPPSKVKLQDFR
ncbi:MAG: hypothetical protein ACI9CF_001976 [Candidatus Omnitrophota bacterium]|jgi:hypothetical protein